ncbi:MAG: acyltransferase family protein [Chitinophagales bacterium]
MEKRKYFPHINALRFVAILSTVSGHWAMDSGLSQNALQLGQYGVDLFFTISGFLITLNLLDSKDDSSLPGGNKIKWFFLNRSLRIFPPYFLVLIGLFLLHLIFRITVWMPGTGIYYFTYSSNFLFYRNGFPPVSYLNHVWTLAVEEQFYVIWPFIIFYVFPKRIDYFICVFILIGIITHFLHPAESGERYMGYVRFLPFANYHTIGTGALLAVIISKKRSYLSLLGNALHPALWLFIFSFAFYTKTAYPPDQMLALFHETALCITTMSLVYHGWKGYKGLVKRIFDWKIIQAIGVISYGIYLYETPISFLVSNTLLKYHVDFWGMPIVKIFLFTIFVGLAAHFSFKYFELPFLKLKKKYH